MFILGSSIVGCLAGGSLAFAGVSQDADIDGAELAHPNPDKVVSSTRSNRAQSQYFVTGNYSYIDTLLPSKVGLSVGFVSRPYVTHELEYMGSRLSLPAGVADIGKFSDQRVSYILRSYGNRNSFAFQYGLSYFSTQVKLGDDLISMITGVPGVNLVELQSLGVHWGMGNRWVLDNNLTWGVDWFTWSQPILEISRKDKFLDYATNQQDKDNVRTALKVMQFFPRWSVLKIHIGYSF